MMLGFSLDAQVYRQCRSHWQSDHLLYNVDVWYYKHLSILRLNPYLELRAMVWIGHVNLGHGNTYMCRYYFHRRPVHTPSNIRLLNPHSRHNPIGLVLKS